MRAVFVALLVFISCMATPLQAVSEVPTSVPCTCPELETLSRSVSAACATPAVAALPQIAAACALASRYLFVQETGTLTSATRSDASNETTKWPSQAHLQQYPARAFTTSSPHGSNPIRLEADNPFARSSVGYSRKYRERREATSSTDMACSSSTRNAVLKSLQMHCAVRRCNWTVSENSNLYQPWFLTLVCSDATALVVPANHTMCVSMAQSCSVVIKLSLSAQDTEHVPLQHAASLIGTWQGNASVMLRGQWGAQGLLAVLQHAHKLVELDAANAGITDLGNALAGLSALQYLDLSGNKLTALSQGVFGGLSALEQLMLDDNKLGRIDATLFYGLSALGFLGLRGNQLTTLPKGIFQNLYSLYELFVSANNLVALEATIFHGLTALEVLYLERNQLTRLPATIFRSVTRLAYLHLGTNQLTRLPESLFQGMSSLQVLTVDNNMLGTIHTTTFRGLPELEILDLSRNKLTGLPKTVFQGLRHLSDLHINNNRLEHFNGTSLEDMSVLQALDLGSNPLTRLPNGTFVLPPGLSWLAQVWLESTGIAQLELANNNLSYLNVKDCHQLTSIVLQPEAQLAVADVTGTALRIEDLPCGSLGYEELVARSMQQMTSLDLLRKCMGNKRQLLDVSANGESRLEAVRASLATVASSSLMGSESWTLLQSKVTVRAQAVIVILVDSPVQCSTQTVQQTVGRDAILPSGNQSFHLTQTESLQIFSCSCIPGYYEHDGECHQKIPFVARAEGIVTVVLVTLLAAGLLTLCQRHFKTRLHHARHDLEMQRGLLEYAETEVLALKRVWELDASDVKLVKRIDGDSEGAFGAVWRGDWDGMVVAVKVLRAGLLQLDSSFADEFDREAEFLMRARHANVVRFFGAGRMPGGEPFVVLELVARGSLRGLLRGDHGSQLDNPLKKRLALDVARGMAYIHSLGALHRDLKSGNVLVTENWRGKVADFGSMRTLLASAASARGSKNQTGDSTTTATASGHTSTAMSNARELTLTAGVGTPLYMALEVLRGNDYGEAADVWAFGVMVWELVEERTPDLLVEMGDTGRGPLLGRLLKCLEAGKRLQLDAGAPAWAERVVTECTVAEASERPRFMVLQEQLVGESEL